MLHTFSLYQGRQHLQGTLFCLLRRSIAWCSAMRDLVDGDCPEAWAQATASLLRPEIFRANPSNGVEWQRALRYVSLAEAAQMCLTCIAQELAMMQMSMLTSLCWNWC